MFYVDPIDGTTNFVHGHPFWCVSIGLVTNGEPILGVIVAPSIGLEWYGWMTAGERCAIRRERDHEESSCAVSRIATLEMALLATGFPYDRRTSADNNFDAFFAIKRIAQGVRRCGSAALDLCLVADGTYDGYWERKLNPWDISGGIAIVRAAGGTVTDFEGGQGFLEGGRVIATNGVVHDALQRELALVEALRK